MRGMTASMPIKVPAIHPLNADERTRAERVASRLFSDLKRLVDRLPEPAKGGSGMARYLGIARNTCQRISLAVCDPSSSLGTLSKLPGIKGLEQFLKALASKGFDHAEIELAEAAVEEFEKLIEELAGSHTRLIAKLAASDMSKDDREYSSEQARAALTAASAHVTGRLVDVTTSLYIFRPDESDQIGRAHV